MRRGEIWWANLPSPVGRRPVLLLSRDESYAVRGLVTVGPVTTRIRSIPVEVPLGKKDGLTKNCVVNLDSITTIPKAALSERLAALSADKLRAVEEALRFALAIPR